MQHLRQSIVVRRVTPTHSRIRLFPVPAIAVVLVVCFSFMANAQNLVSDSVHDRQQTAIQDSVSLKKPDRLSTEEIISGESEESRKPFDGQPRGTTPPGPFRSATDAQDSAYKRALQLVISARARFDIEARLAAANFELPIASSGDSPVNIARGHLAALPREVFAPRPQQVVQHQINMAKSAEMPTVGAPRATETLTGFQIPLSTIGDILGFTKDVSPTMRYFVEYPTTVEIVIFSIQAKVVSIILHGKHRPGSYTVTWNGRDQKGRPMPAGDYIGEIRIGKETVIRKHIQLR